MKLYGARAAAGLSQEQVAHRAGISVYTYQKLEHGESNPGTPANPRLRTLFSLAGVLNVAVADLLPEHPANETPVTAAANPASETPQKPVQSR
ncbi:MAG: helix-turn-helix transcriptional regulator [Bifidobacteriaceae bacterium]|nr:helix-turn-helix transcriptional regulator [Bifidobacteriaceae bacterium]